MTPQEFEYIQRAMKALESPMELSERIKVQRTMGQILTKSADHLAEVLVDKQIQMSYNTNLTN